MKTVVRSTLALVFPAGTNSQAILSLNFSINEETTELRLGPFTAHLSLG